jgi:hypothetical protein
VLCALHESCVDDAGRGDFLNIKYDVTQAVCFKVIGGHAFEYHVYYRAASTLMRFRVQANHPIGSINAVTCQQTVMDTVHQTSVARAGHDTNGCITGALHKNSIFRRANSPPGSGGVDAKRTGWSAKFNKEFVLEFNRPPRLRCAQPPRLIQAGSSPTANLTLASSV